MRGRIVFCLPGAHLLQGRQQTHTQFREKHNMRIKGCRHRGPPEMCRRGAEDPEPGLLRFSQLFLLSSAVL